MSGEVVAPPVWHTIRSDDLLALLRRAAAGEDPEFVYLEAYASAEHEHPRPEGEGAA